MFFPFNVVVFFPFKVVVVYSHLRLLLFFPISGCCCFFPFKVVVVFPHLRLLLFFPYSDRGGYYPQEHLLVVAANAYYLNQLSLRAHSENETATRSKNAYYTTATAYYTIMMTRKRPKST